MRRRLFVKTMGKVKSEIQEEGYKEKNKKKPEDFTRERKINFYQTCVLVLETAQKGMRKAIKEFMKTTNVEYENYSKAAFCKARQKVKPEAFLGITELVAKDFYQEYPVKTQNGYRILAIDGSRLNLPNTEENMERFGGQSNQQGQQAQAILSLLYDVLNHVVVDARVGKAFGNERELAKEHLDEYEKYKDSKTIITADRGYPSEDMIEAFEKHGVYYVLRTNKNEFWKEIKDVKDKDDICIERKCKDKQTLKVRVITVKLSDDTEETLLTNMFDTNLDVDFFKEVYRLRWKIESNYNLLKNQMQLENFSSILSNCILQDIYAQTFLLNLAACLETECNDDIDKINESGRRKYPVTVNRTVCISELSDNVIELFWASSRIKDKIFKHIQEVMMKNLTVIRDDRSFPRDSSNHPALKFHNNYGTI